MRKTAGVILLLLLAGCGDNHPKKFNEQNNPCVFNSIRQAKYWWQHGYEVRYGWGTYKGEGHKWTERRSQWVLCSDTTGVSAGRPISDYPDYVVIYPYMYPTRPEDFKLPKEDD